MSTNKSQNLNLHLWEPEDDFLRTEFNENFAALDTAVKADRTAISTAQSAANAAMSKANAAYAPDQKPYAVGAYTGTGETKTIELGFHPSFLIICGIRGQTSGSGLITADHSIATAGNAASGRLAFTDTGFTVYASGVNGTHIPDLSARNITYDYIAFR